MFTALGLSHFQFKSVAQLVDHTVSPLEARQIDARYYRHFYKRDDLFSVGSQCHEPFDHQRLKLIEELGPMTSQNFNVLLSQLEGSCFKVKIAWAVREHKAEINVDHVALTVQQDVSIVPVLDL